MNWMVGNAIERDGVNNLGAGVYCQRPHASMSKLLVTKKVNFIIIIRKQV